MDREVELETLGGTMLGIGGAAGVVLVVPLEATITEVKGRAEPKSEAIPASAIVIKAPQDAVADAEPFTMPATQELTAVAAVVEPDIEADNGVIQGIDSVLLPPAALRSF
jgi:Fasciclin domain